MFVAVFSHSLKRDDNNCHLSALNGNPVKLRCHSLLCVFIFSSVTFIALFWPHSPPFSCVVRGDQINLEAVSAFFCHSFGCFKRGNCCSDSRYGHILVD